MPLYEYVCRKCGQPSELLVFGETKPKCPSCGSEDLDKQWSVPASGPSKGPGSCGPMPGGGFG
jgi:putative FmdB family regulatory protein